MISARSLAVQGVGFGSRQLATLGYSLFVVSTVPVAGVGGIRYRGAEIRQNEDKVVISVRFMEFERQGWFTDDDVDVKIKISELAFSDPSLKVSALKMLGDTVNVVNMGKRR